MGAVTAPAARLIALNLILLVLATVAVALRVISTRIRHRKWQAHDSLCMFSLVSVWGPIESQRTDGVEALFDRVYNQSNRR